MNPSDLDWSDLDWPRVVLAALVVAVVAAGATAATTSDAPLGAYNYGWDGASALRTQAEAGGTDPQVARNAEAYRAADPAETVAVVLSPDESYRPTEVAPVVEFVARGGTLVVAADSGPHADDLLAAVGADARIDGAPVRDDRYNYRTPSLPVATNASDRRLARGVSSLALNYGTVVEPNGATVLVNTSEYAYLDRNRNETLDPSETPERRPVATVERVGEGRVVVVSDPSVFVNAMMDRSDNRAFARNLLGTADRVLLDYSHSAGVPPLVAATLALRGSPLAQIGLGALALALVGVWSRPELLTRVSTRLRRPAAADRGESASETAPSATTSLALSTEEVVAAVRRRQPDWSDDRIRRVARRIDRIEGGRSGRKAGTSEREGGETEREAREK
ncbi:DUF4350 domain-containing protein [Halorussus caseinilyticus]|uniref:DUF4350 domain-containing protein n=1 Tax=Halorussus caseinilyticus TaxID=3034025 RepID=UPI0023E883B2|nr:DUF4350 domain-containing protein [Halorussus sp. DT72]